ncbi:uncharacterized protein TrAtP1_008889 [Trichoderma atroviride]|uniref:uncharacterized protein n=1 Tax=Hypocrea atroviridis TaxID=63577 RepID=UPI00332CBB76|nr:hypothetical protein TrAtP1_008889 [Trichoderma atroviride]
MQSEMRVLPWQYCLYLDLNLSAILLKDNHSDAAGMAEHKPSAVSRDLQALIAQKCLASSCLTANLTETVRLPNTFIQSPHPGATPSQRNQVLPTYWHYYYHASSSHLASMRQYIASSYSNDWSASDTLSSCSGSATYMAKGGSARGATA